MTDYEKEVEKRWNELTEGVKDETRQKWWERIRSAYTESHRHYHNLKHLHRMFQHYDQCKNVLKDNCACTYAVFFHDIVYDPKAKDNEAQSAVLFKQFGTEANIERVDCIADFIENTTTHCTEAHMNPGQCGSEDLHYFLDFDMAILGVDPAEYDEYRQQIRQEYNHLDDATYKHERAKVLRLFLQIPNIFATEKFRSQYEQKARNNIQKEIELLES